MQKRDVLIKSNPNLWYVLNIHRFKLDIEKTKQNETTHFTQVFTQTTWISGGTKDIISEKRALAHAKLNWAKLLHHVVRAYRFGRKECHRKIYHFLRICVSLTQLEVEFNPTHPSATKTAIQAWPEWRGKSCDSRRKRTETWARHVRACTSFIYNLLFV